MPFTLLHVPLVAPIHKKASWLGFLLANVVVDMPVAIGMIYSTSSYKHYSQQWANVHDTPTHTLYGAAILTLLLWPIGRTRKWLYGVAAGAFSHPILDALYHSDVYLIGHWGPPGLLGIALPHWALDYPLLAALAGCTVVALRRPRTLREWR